jgi:hypothetical protein
MAFVYKCDRCGKIVDNASDGGGNGPFVWDGTLSKDQEHMDLCEGCYNSLVQWLDCKKKKKTTRVVNGECHNCKFASYAEHMYPCNCCLHNFVDHWEKKEGNN